VIFLHQNGAAVNVISTDHRTPLHQAAYFGHKDIGKHRHSIDFKFKLTP